MRERKEEISKDDVARLIRGRPSKGRVGSREIRHRLRQDELRRLSVARERGYLLRTHSTRTALENAWFLDCKARNIVCYYVERTEKGLAITRHESQEESGRIVSCVNTIAEVRHLLGLS